MRVYASADIDLLIDAYEFRAMLVFLIRFFLWRILWFVNFLKLDFFAVKRFFIFIIETVYFGKVLFFPILS